MFKKQIFIGILILGFLISAGGGYVYFNSVNSLIQYNNVTFKTQKSGEKVTFKQGYAYRRDNVPIQVSVSGTHYEMGLQYGVLLKNEIRQMDYKLYSVIGYYSREIGLPKNLVYIYFKYKINRLSKYPGKI